MYSEELNTKMFDDDIKMECINFFAMEKINTDPDKRNNT